MASTTKRPKRGAAKQKRVYVHFNNTEAKAFPLLPSFTIVSTITNPEYTTIGDLKNELITSFNSAHPSIGSLLWPIGTVGVQSESKETLSETKVAQQALEDRCDIFVTFIRPLRQIIESNAALVAVVSSAASTTRTATSAPTTASAPKASSISSSSSVPSPSAGPPPKDLASLQTTVVQSLTMAQEVQKKGNLRKARDIYEQLLGLVAGVTGKEALEQTNTLRQVCYQQLGAIYLHNKKYEKASSYFTKAVTFAEKDRQLHPEPPYPPTVPGTTSDPLEMALLLSLAGQAQFGLEEYEAAHDLFQKSMKFMKQLGKKAKKKDVHDLQIWIARCLYSTSDVRGNRDAAIKLLELVLKEDEHHIGCLTYYSQVALDVGQMYQAIPFLLRAIVTAAHATDSVDIESGKLAKANFTKVVSDAAGVKALMTELHTAATSPAALTFLAQTVKDQGAIHSAISLYEHAFRIQAEAIKSGKPVNPSPITGPAGVAPAMPGERREEAKESEIGNLINMTLNLIHTHEVAYEYQAAFDVTKKFLTDYPTLTVGDVKAAKFLSVIANVVKVFDHKLRAGTATDVPAFDAIPEIFDAGQIQVQVPSQHGDGDKEGKVLGPGKRALNTAAVRYPPAELNLLAIYFTTVKILYVCGALQPIPALIQLIEPLRKDRELHMTSIRNEHAYYSCISQVLSKIPFPILTNPNDKDIVYVCGDSHCMSSAWQTIEVKGHSKPVLLQPKLVTGLKCWHLRPACKFYPKRNFEFALKTIPNGSNVIFVFGEIDCREGILLAVEKGKYETVEEGIKESVKVYIKALEEVVKKTSITAYVHPIVPVLDVTRKTVIQFMHVLKTHVLGSPRLRWMEFFDQLLLPDGSFDSRYGLDGTHMSPSYVPFLQRALSDAPPPSTSSSSTTPAKK